LVEPIGEAVRFGREVRPEAELDLDMTASLRGELDADVRLHAIKPGFASETFVEVLAFAQKSRDFAEMKEGATDADGLTC
jgi:hypothetical protein